MVSSNVNDHIPVMTAVGRGGTTLAAFHAALASVNLDGYNLIRLSSVVPPHITVDRFGQPTLPTGRWGDKLYCVYADRRSAVPGKEAWAGLGWVQRLDGQGGLFVEHAGDDREEVAIALRTSLRDLVRTQRYEYGQPDWLLSGTVCTGEPVCSLVIAPYETEPWARLRCA